MRKILLISLFSCLSLIISFLLGAFVADRSDSEKITVAIVKQAQKIMNLDFSDAEADSMLKDLNDQR